MGSALESRTISQLISLNGGQQDFHYIERSNMVNFFIVLLFGGIGAIFGPVGFFIGIVLGVIGWASAKSDKSKVKPVDRTSGLPVMNMPTPRSPSIPVPETVLIRLSPKATTGSGTLFFSIKFGIGRGSYITSNAEQGAESVEWVEAAIEAKREFVEIGLQVLRADAVVNAA